MHCCYIVLVTDSNTFRWSIINLTSKRVRYIQLIHVPPKWAPTKWFKTPLTNHPSPKPNHPIPSQNPTIPINPKHKTRTNHPRTQPPQPPNKTIPNNPHIQSKPSPIPHPKLQQDVGALLIIDAMDEAEEQGAPRAQRPSEAALASKTRKPTWSMAPLQ